MLTVKLSPLQACKNILNSLYGLIFLPIFSCNIFDFVQTVFRALGDFGEVPWCLSYEHRDPNKSADKRRNFLFILAHFARDVCDISYLAAPASAFPIQTH